jgi:ETC complex I subunit-like protein
MLARIFQPPKSAMQSGMANTEQWVLEFAPAAARMADPLMGWTSGTDTRTQLRLTFETREEAVAFAEREGIPYAVEVPHERQIRPKAYADNFRYDRIGRWTH